MSHDLSPSAGSRAPRWGPQNFRRMVPPAALRFAGGYSLRPRWGRVKVFVNRVVCNETFDALH